MKRVLAVMTINPDFIQFAIPQLKSILSRLPIPLTTLLQQQLTINPKHSYEITHQTLRNFPFVTLTVPNFMQHEQFFKKACKQSVMLHRFVLLLAKSKNYQQLKQNSDQQLIKQRSRDWQEKVAADFVGRNRIQGRKYQIDKINKIFEDLDICGKLDINNATKRYQIIQDHVWYQFHHESPVESTIKNIYFGIQLCNNKIGKAKFNTVFQLSNRIYLGPTSADNDLAFMMCNQAKVQPGSFVLDPFVGTGGLIIPPASRGAYVFGCDLDMRVLNGYSVGRINKRSTFYQEDKKFQVFTPKIQLSFQQYGIPSPNIMRMDSTKLAFKNEELFDAIITDPPYGMRAMSRSVTGKKQAQEKQTEEANKQQVAQQLLQAKQQKQQSDTDQVAVKQTTQQKTQQRSQQQVNQEAQEKKELLQAKLKKHEKRKLKKEGQRLKKSLLTQQQVQFKKSINQKLNRERIEKWQTFDRAKVQCTQRQKIFQGLIVFARKCLKQGGRLVFLYPVFQGEQYQKVNSLPEHKGFTVVDMSQNKLAKGNSRILVTLQKQFIENKQ